jgi:PAS domain S-box-containing protein
MKLFDSFNQWVYKNFGIKEKTYSNILTTRLTISFVLFIIFLSLFSLPVLFFGYKLPYFILSIAVLAVLTGGSVLFIKFKNIKGLSVLCLVVQFLMINSGILISQGKVTEITILWAVSMILFAYMTIGKKTGLSILLAQFALVTVFVEFSNFDNPLMLNGIAFSFPTNIVSLLLPMSLIFYYLYYYRKTDDDIKNELAKTNQTLNNLNLSLKHNINQLSFTQELAKLGGWEYDIHSKKVTWNHQVYLIYDLPLDFVPSLELALSYYPKESRILLQEAMDRAISKGAPWDLELKFINSKEKQLWVRTIGEPVYMDGRIVKLKGVIQNITDRKRTEYSLQLFSELINDSDEAIIVTESNGNIIFANNQAAEMYGFSRQELHSLSIQDIHDHRNDDSKWERFLVELKKKGKITHEHDFRDAEGKSFPVEERSLYSEVALSGYIITFIRDISERKLAESKIKRNLEQQSILSEISYLFNTSDEFDFKVREVLRITGNYIKVSKVFIFEDILNGKAVSNTYEWCNRGIESQRDDLQAIPYSLFPSWKELMHTDNAIEAFDFAQLPEDIYSVFRPHQIVSLLAFPLYIDNKYFGFIGFAEAKRKRNWESGEKEFLKTLTNIVANSFEQKVAIDSLRKSERRFREFAELLPEMVCETSVNGKITFANNMACERFGLDNETLQKGVIFFNLFSEEDRLRAWENFESKIKGEQVENEEFIIKTIDGKEIPVLVYVNRIMRDHLPAGLRAVMVDISERKKAEEQIISMAKFPEESPYPILRVERNGEVSYCNKKGLIVKDFLQQNYNAYFKDLFAIIYETGRIEELEINIAGTFFSLTLTPVREFNYINIYCKDVTQKKIDEEKLRLSEQRFHDVTDAAGEYIWETDKNYNYIYTSDKVKTVLGFESSEMLGKKPFNFLPVDEIARVEKFVIECAQRGEGFVNFEHKSVTKNKKIIWLMITGIPIFDHNRKFLGFRGVAMDITQRRKYEDDLRDAKLVAEQASKVKAEFLSTMSHEIRTPMNAVIGLTHILIQEEPRPDQLETLKTLRFSAENLLVLLNDILDFSKIEAGKIVFEEIDFNLEEMLKNLRNTFFPKAEEKGIDIVLNYDNEIPRNIFGDPVRLAQILNNLVSNAIKFTDTGKVGINVLKLAKQEDHFVVKFEVTDTGIGIAEEQLERIFESFTQASSDITRKFGGTGLGLAISKKLVELQGGQLQVESLPEEGSKFHFYLRYKMGNPENIAQTDSLFSGYFESLNKIKVLIVEDNLINQVVARKFLQKWDVEYEITDNGQKAVDLIKEKDFDLVLMDIQMPVMDGYEASRRIRSLDGEKYKKLPIIALTASVLTEVHKKITSCGMNDYLIKPFNPSELYSKIKKYTKK